MSTEVATAAVTAPTPLRRVRPEDFQHYVRQVFRLFRISSMHLPNNEAVRKMIEQTQKRFRELRELELTRLNLLFVDRTVFVNGQLLKADPDIYQLAIQLAGYIQKLGFNELTIAWDVDEDDLRALMSVFVGAYQAGPGSTRDEIRFKRVSLRRVKSEVLDLFRTQPVSPRERLVRSYASALIIMRHTWDRVLEGRPPSFKSLKRLVQQLVRLSAEQPVAFQLMARMRNVHEDPAGQAVKTAMLAIALLRPVTGDLKILGRVGLASLYLDLGRPRALGAIDTDRAIDASKLAHMTRLQAAVLPDQTAVAGVISGQLHPEALERVIVAFESQQLTLAPGLAPLPTPLSLVDLEPVVVQTARRYTDAMAFDVRTQRSMTPEEAIVWLVWNARNRLEVHCARMLANALRIELDPALFESAPPLAVEPPTAPPVVRGSRIVLQGAGDAAQPVNPEFVSTRTGSSPSVSTVAGREFTRTGSAPQATAPRRTGVTAPVQGSTGAHAGVPGDGGARASGARTGVQSAVQSGGFEDLLQPYFQSRTGLHPALAPLPPVAAPPAQTAASQASLSERVLSSPRQPLAPAAIETTAIQQRPGATEPVPPPPAEAPERLQHLARAADGTPMPPEPSESTDQSRFARAAGPAQALMERSESRPISSARLVPVPVPKAAAFLPDDLGLSEAPDGERALTAHEGAAISGSNIPTLPVLPVLPPVTAGAATPQEIDARLAALVANARNASLSDQQATVAMPPPTGIRSSDGPTAIGPDTAMRRARPSQPLGSQTVMNPDTAMRLAAAMRSPLHTPPPPGVPVAGAAPSPHSVPDTGMRYPEGAPVPRPEPAPDTGIRFPDREPGPPTTLPRIEAPSGLHTPLPLAADAPGTESTSVESPTPARPVHSSAVAARLAAMSRRLTEQSGSFARVTGTATPIVAPGVAPWSAPAAPAPSAASNPAPSAAPPSAPAPVAAPTGVAHPEPAPAPVRSPGVGTFTPTAAALSSAPAAPGQGTASARLASLAAGTGPGTAAQQERTVAIPVAPAPNPAGGSGFPTAQQRLQALARSSERGAGTQEPTAIVSVAQSPPVRPTPAVPAPQPSLATGNELDQRAPSTGRFRTVPRRPPSGSGSSST